MKKKLLIFGFISLLLSTPIFLMAESETVSLGSEYTNQVFYSFNNKIVKTAPIDDWDVAFQMGSNGGVHINGAKGLVVYHSDFYTYLDFGDEIDTSGLADSWTIWYNSEGTWNTGAFNLGLDGFQSEGDFGWGAYNMQTHAIAGDELFVIKKADGQFIQFYIDQLFGGKYTFKYANLDGSDVQEIQLNKNDYDEKLLIYYNFDNGIVDRDPLIGDWELLFTKYVVTLDMGGEKFYQGVTGVKMNEGIKAVKMEAVDPETVQAPDESEFSYNITTIGYDWKKYDFSENKYEVLDDHAYFVMFENEFGFQSYKIVFTGFDPDNGDITFDLSEVVVSVEESHKLGDNFAVYPNIIDRGENFYAVFDLNPSLKNNLIEVFNTAGSKVAEKSIPAGSKIGTINISGKELSAGMYFVVLKSGSDLAVKKLIVK